VVTCSILLQESLRNTKSNCDNNLRNILLSSIWRAMVEIWYLFNLNKLSLVTARTISSPIYYNLISCTIEHISFNLDVKTILQPSHAYSCHQNNVLFCWKFACFSAQLACSWSRFRAPVDDPFYIAIYTLWQSSKEMIHLVTESLRRTYSSFLSPNWQTPRQLHRQFFKLQKAQDISFISRWPSWSYHAICLKYERSNNKH